MTPPPAGARARTAEDVPGHGARDLDGALTDGLTDAVAVAVLGDAATDADLDHLALVRRCIAAEQATREITQQAVDAARIAGHSWAAIGAEIGMTRQAAQQRFGGTPTDPASPSERWLGPVTAFDELPELELAGRMGWHTAGAGMLRHRMVHTETQWEHRRLLWPKSPRSLLGDGWQIGCRAFPWIYLIRDTGLPAETE